VVQESRLSVSLTSALWTTVRILVNRADALGARPQLASLLARAQSLSAGRNADEAQLQLVIPEPPRELIRPARLRRPARACLETNLTRRGFWLALAGGAPRHVAESSAEDRLGRFTLEPGLSGPLTVTELEVITWVCSRWRELGDPGVRQVPLSLAQLAGDFGWTRSGRNLRRLSLALDRLRDVAITAELWARGERAARARRRFGLLADWQAGRPDSSGSLRRYGWATLGDWLLAQLQAGHLTYLSWSELRALNRPVAKRLYAFLEGERFVGGETQWPITPALFASLGMGAANPRQARATLAAAGREVERLATRYARVGVATGLRGHHLVAALRQ
jgi:Replication initiator protein A